MITEKELKEAIRQCEREPVTQSKIAKLADFYIVYDHLFGDPYQQDYSYSRPVETPIIEIKSDTEFLKTINGKRSDAVWRIMDELMEAIKALHPRMYQRVLEKISDI